MNYRYAYSHLNQPLEADVFAVCPVCGEELFELQSTLFKNSFTGEILGCCNCVSRITGGYCKPDSLKLC